APPGLPSSTSTRGENWEPLSQWLQAQRMSVRADAEVASFDDLDSLPQRARCRDLSGEIPHDFTPGAFPRAFIHGHVVRV
ncbi:hypothetical protein, partial [Streptomyces sp. NPDC005568]|uniref:hypothetical protein n=2 Tax=Streptomyces TaxID=1883 RepID=UPI0033B461E7